MPASAAPFQAQRLTSIASAQVSIRVHWDPTWKASPCGRETVGPGELEEVDGLVGRDAELAPERQLAATLGHLQSDHHARSRRELRQLAYLRLTVDHEQVETAPVRFFDMRRNLDRRAEDHLLRLHAERQDAPNLVLRRDVEPVTGVAQELEDRLLAIGLDRIEDRRVQGRERLGD